MNVLFLPNFSAANPYQLKLAESLEGHGIHVILDKGKGWLPLIETLKAYRRLDVLHLHWSHPYTRSALKAATFLFEVLLLKFTGTKIVWTVHNLLNHEKHASKLEMLCNQIIVRLCDQLIVHCLFAKDAVVKVYNLPERVSEKINVVAHGHYIDTYENRMTPDQARSRLGFAADETVFLCFGMVRPYKGVDKLLDAFQQLNDPKVRLLIVGKPFNESIRATLAERCLRDPRIHTVLEFVPDKDIQVYMNAASAVVLAYQDVLTSGSALLAMSFKKPIIIPRLGCVNELLDEHGSFLFDPDSENNGLLQAMKQALVCDLDVMGRYNYDLARRLRWSDIGRKTCEVYNQCWSRFLVKA